MQLRLTFNSVHSYENNPQSQANLDLRKEDFNKQCWDALVRMLKGDKIVNKDPEIGHMARRAKDLIDFKGIPVQRDWALKPNGEREKFKWYFIREEDRLNVARRIIDLITA